MKAVHLLLLSFALISSPYVASADEPASPVDETYLYEVARYLYRWHLDERDVEAVDGAKTLEVRVRELKPELDPGDHSRFLEIRLPALRCRVQAKQADYLIEETGAELKSRGFRIYAVSREDGPGDLREGEVVVPVDFAKLRDYLSRTRSQPDFPDQQLFERLREKMRMRLLAQGEALPQDMQTLYLAPLSPVSNEWWVYWENRKLLIRFTTDVDLTNPDVWEKEQIGIDTWDAFSQMVITMNEAPGSNEFLTRDQIGRALYNCLVLGRRHDMMPREE